jgi:hypothetical protein
MAAGLKDHVTLALASLSVGLGAMVADLASASAVSFLAEPICSSVSSLV